MVKGPGIYHRITGNIHPLGLLLAAMFMISAGLHYGEIVAVPLSALYFLVLNRILKVKAISLRESAEVPDSFLLTFSKYMKVQSPEVAFLTAYARSPTVALSRIVMRLKNGQDLHSALSTANFSSMEDRVIFRLVADLVSFSKEDACQRIPIYVGYRQEKRKWKSEMTMKLNVLSLRFRLLMAISAASLAVICFTSPLLASFASFKVQLYTAGVASLMNFNLNVFFALLSSSIISSYLYSKMMIGVDGRKLASFSAIVFILVELILVLAIGGRI